MNDSFTEATDRKSTMGLDHYGRTFHVADRDLKLQLWDTGGKGANIFTVLVRTVLSKHRLNMELDLQSLFMLLRTAVPYSLAETPQTPSPRIRAHIRERH